MILAIFAGRYHGALVTNNEDWEAECMRAGRMSGDLIHPLIYCPELHFSEFASAVADMKNSSAVSDLHFVQLTFKTNIHFTDCSEKCFSDIVS